MTNIVIQGLCGRMGRVLAGMLAAREDCRLVAGVDVMAAGESAEGLPCPVYASLKELAPLMAPGRADRPDVLVDFSHPDATDAALDWCAAQGLPIVVCTTGLSPATRAKLEATAAQTAVFYSANMSLGINLLAQLARRAQAVLAGFDIEIIEKHHRNKLDAPSGTALMLAEAINAEAGGRYTYIYDRHDVRQKRGDDELGISAVRGGSIVGEHEILFAGQDEVVTLSHTAYSRDVFAAGAVRAALFLAGQPAGRYSMDDLLEQIK